MKDNIITAKMNKDGTTVEVLKDGTVRPFPVQPIQHGTEAEILAAAHHDPDAMPLTEADFERMKSTPRAKIIRRSMQLTQEEFASCYHIPLGTLRDWEQGRSEPDQTARAYLQAIAVVPETIKKALQQA